MTIFIIRDDVHLVLEKIARQKQVDVGGTFQDCYDETLSDYKIGAISDAFIGFVLQHPDAKIVMEY